MNGLRESQIQIWKSVLDQLKFQESMRHHRNFSSCFEYLFGKFRRPMVFNVMNNIARVRSCAGRKAQSHCPLVGLNFTVLGPQAPTTNLEPPSDSTPNFTPSVGEN
ncbi:uncharacterized protein DS421_9g282990 [Arachis hypogaea]|nr:uncharacterized protein DS421_9g282990 [Arachis hypogaea]